MLAPKLNTITVAGSRRFHGSFAWGLQPFFLWLQILGLPPVQSRPSWTTFQRRAVLLIGTIVMVWTTSSNIHKIVNYIDVETVGSGQKLSLTWMWTKVLQELQNHCFSILINLTFFIVVHVQQTSMWSTILLVEPSLRFHTTFYQSVRRTSRAALALIILVTRFN